MLDKAHVYQALKKELETKISRLQIAFDDLLLALTSNTKSSAGDKHETGRAMAQLEQEKLSSQLGQLTLLKEALAKIEPDEKHESIQFGSLIKTGNGYFFLSIGLGKISLDDENIFCLTATSPMGKVLIGKSAGDTIQMNSNTIQIISVT
ncbi:MAG: 3-oxoacyl-ACP synthase [Crocinitomicaceae bacterium]|nr:3-oxoacyl-ACP synthase [Crocinitomicaceae bacterium]